ncbi:Csu type fimbrial protein [Aliidiomarina indica]|uniref:Csu type fimbrial protein n=1 Tax=Aliidiomarina indica TaxID=2749147 RepID=UPI00188F93F8|nr:spore coat U domain-containing protein [Aliidiomarina indica]
MSIILNRKLVLTFAGLSLCLFSAGAHAGCMVSAQGVAFGLYDGLNVSPTESTGVIEVTCDVSTSYQLSLSTGTGSFTERKMANGNDNLVYNLFTDPSYSFIWGDGTSFTSTVNGVTDSTQVHYVYGRVPARQDVAVGTYSDVIIVTMQF